jgi:hypothetical protein
MRASNGLGPVAVGAKRGLADMKPEGRALAVAELLRQGYTGREVSEMLEVIDRGGSMQEAMAALHSKPESSEQQGEVG